MLTGDICRDMIVSSGDIATHDTICGTSKFYRGESTMKNRLLITAVSLAAATLAVYLISTVTGGAFYDFCKSAVSWVLLGIGLACAAAYLDTTEQTEQIEKNE